MSQATRDGVQRDIRDMLSERESGTRGTRKTVTVLRKIMIDNIFFTLRPVDTRDKDQLVFKRMYKRIEKKNRESTIGAR